MNNDINKTIEELEVAGASKSEAEELAYLSKNLSNALSFERSPETKRKFLEKAESLNSNPQKNFPFMHRPLFASILGVILLLGFATVVSAQDSLPGQPLYTVKRATENVISAINPSFNSEILKRRSIEIKNLSQPANQDVDKAQNVRNAIKDYESQLNEHKNINSKAIEESKINLEEATKNSTDGAKREIEDVLRQTETKTSEQNSSHESENLENSADH